MNSLYLDKGQALTLQLFIIATHSPEAGRFFILLHPWLYENFFKDLKKLFDFSKG